MAVLVTPDRIYQTVYTTKSASNRGVVMAHADVNASGVTYAAGGVTCSFPVHNLFQVFIENRIVTASAVMYAYDYTNTKLQVYTPEPTTTAAGLIMQEVATDTALSSLTAIRAFFIGNE